MKELTFTNGGYIFIIATVVCYLVGCFNFAVLISKIKKHDIRDIGSGNPGSMNMTRTFGLKIGGINFFCDVLKGGLPVLAGYFIFKDYVFAGTTVAVSDFSRYYFGVCAVIGHIFPVTMKFRGGKGIASTFGLFMFAMPCVKWWYFFICAAIYIGVLIFILTFQWGSLGSLIGVAGFSVWQAALFVVKYSDCLSNGYVIAMMFILVLINLLTWTAHRLNIARLLAGEEHRTTAKGKHRA